jgi:hypothetical protein
MDAIIQQTWTRAKALLLLDEGTHTTNEIANLCGCTAETVRGAYRRYCEHGLPGVLGRKPFRTVRVVTPAIEAAILALSREPPPPGDYKPLGRPPIKPPEGAADPAAVEPAGSGAEPRWTTATLAKEAMRRGIVERISPVTVYRILVKEQQGRDA